MPRLLTALSLFLSLAASLAGRAAEPSLEEWRATRLARLTEPEGWLSLIGLHWLAPGANSVGAAGDNAIPLAAGPAHLGTVTLAENRTVSLAVASGVQVTVDGKSVASATLAYGENPTIVRSGSVSFFVIERGDKLGLRVRDTESPRRKNFAGIDCFPPDPAWRIVARWERFATPREIPITNVLGQTFREKVPGKAVFTHEGHSVELLPVAEGDELFFIIADATSGVETYGASRFLYAPLPTGDTVVLDFNRAQNPPCAFTPFATCPLPPKENRMPFRIAAGEKDYRGAHR